MRCNFVGRTDPAAALNGLMELLERRPDLRGTYDLADVLADLARLT